MNIGIFSPNYPSLNSAGGIGTYSRNLAHGLAAQGHQVDVLVGSADGQVMQDGPVTVHGIGTGYLPVADRLLPGAGAMLRTWNAARKLTTQRNLAVFEFPNWEGFGLLATLSRRRPVVVRLHTSSREAQRIDSTPSTWLARWDVRREHLLARYADALVTHSAAHRKMMADELGIPEGRIALIPHGIEPIPRDRKLAPRADIPTVVFLGRMERRKGTLDLILAVPQIIESVPEARFVLIGTDRPHCPGNRTHAQYIADEIGPKVASRITLAGPLPDGEVERWLQTATVFVAPSLYESFGLIFLEAMRWGTPVIGTRVGGIPEIIEDGESGVLVPPSDPRALGEAIAGLLRNPTRRAELGEAGRLRVESCFTIARMAARTAEFYSETIARRRAR